MATTQQAPAERPTAVLSHVLVSAIQTHPRNPRHRAVADDELVASVKEHGLVQPLVVAVLEEAGPDEAGGWTEGTYLLVGGHRRLSALKKARVKEVAVVVRRDLDTEGKQLEAMILENSSRVDLTPIEEAEGFAALVELKYKQKDIARVTGKSAKTVSERLKLLKLSKTTQKRVHAGQMTIEDASSIVEFADDPALTKKLEQASASGYNFKWEIQRARQRRKEAAELAGVVADLLARGVPQVAATTDDHTAVTKAGEAKGQPVFDADMDRHDDSCLVFGVVGPSDYSGGAVRYFCTHPDGHAEKRSDEEKQDAAERQAIQDERDRRRADVAAARAHRLETMTDAFGGVVLPDLFVDLLRATIPAIFDRADRYGTYAATDAYQDLVGIHAADRWDGTTTKVERTKLLQHLDDVVIGETSTAKSIVALLLALAESSLAETNGRYDDRLKALGHAAVTPYLDTLEHLGHEWSPVDNELRTAHGHLQAASEDEGAAS